MKTRELALVAMVEEVAQANRHAVAAVEEHVRAGRSTYFGDADHVYEHTAEGAIYEVVGDGLQRVKLVQ